jgi:5-methylcytosine-specific restriction protein A
VVREYVLRAADGVCQGCGEDAPFVGEDGEPYLDVHHLHRRSDGGADHPDNVVALCPNCQRWVHYGEDGEEFNRELIEVTEQPDRS